MLRPWPSVIDRDRVVVLEPARPRHRAVGAVRGRWRSRRCPASAACPGASVRSGASRGRTPPAAGTRRSRSAAPPAAHERCPCSRPSRRARGARARPGRARRSGARSTAWTPGSSSGRSPRRCGATPARARRAARPAAPRGVEPGPQSAGADGHHDVVDGRAVRVLDRLGRRRARPSRWPACDAGSIASLNGVRGGRTLGSGGGGSRSSPRLRPEVQHGAERSAQAPADLVCRRDQRRVPRGLPELPSGSSTEKHGPSRLARQAQAGPREQLQFRRHAIGLPRLGRRPDLRPLRVLVEHQRQQLHPRRAVDRCVVEDREDREALIGQALDDVGQPQWPPPVERPRDDAPDEVGELLDRCPAAGPPYGARGSRSSKSESSIQNG